MRIMKPNDFLELEINKNKLGSYSKEQITEICCMCLDVIKEKNKIIEEYMDTQSNLEEEK